MALTMKPMPDGFGFVYGEYVDADGNHWRVNIMPPLPDWRGDMKMGPPYGPHATDWVVYLNDEEIARGRTRDELDRLISQRLLT